MTIGLLTTLDPLRIASGVYRVGIPRLEEGKSITYHRDGKTASVDVIRSFKPNAMWINTNGKTDASVAMNRADPPTSDEATMLLAAALPLAAFPDAQSAAVIGFGSGLTTHALLASPALKRVDSIEIEAAMVEGAQHFRPHNERAYSDPRSRILIDDAKAFFARTSTRYDIIMSEPSNPWVSGVASLFSDEFYGRIRSKLTDNGVLVQWIQLYEIDPQLVGAMLRALGRHFPNYEIYAPDTGDLLLLARMNGDPIVLSPRIFDLPPLAEDLRRLGIGHMGNFVPHRIASHRVFRPWLGAGIVNSDYHPFVDLHAPKARYMRRDAIAMLWPRTDVVPVSEILEKRIWDSALPPSPAPGGGTLRHGLALKGEDIVSYLVSDPQRPAPPWMTSFQLASLHTVRGLLLTCDRLPEIDQLWDEVLILARNTLGTMSSTRQRPLWEAFLKSPCYAKMAPMYQDWLQLLAHTAARDAPAMAPVGERMLARAAIRTRNQASLLLTATVTALLAKGKKDKAGAMIAQHWANHEKAAYEWPTMDMLLKVARAR